MSEDSNILVVDDSKFSHKLLEPLLIENGYNMKSVYDGEEALNYLFDEEPDVDAIVLDWIMPKMDGISFLKRIKKERNLANIPVIMQTSKAKEKDILTGIDAGAYYYFTKPVDKQLFLSILKSSISRYRNYIKTLSIKKDEEIIPFLKSGEIRFQTIEEGGIVAKWLSEMSEDPESTAIGLRELMVNAVEHGNLGISYEEKSKYLEESVWYSEIKKRYALEENKHKYVSVKYDVNDKEITVCIKDFGNGFDFSKYMTLDPERAFESHGRGIFLTKSAYIGNIEYTAPGNEVKLLLKRYN